MYVRNITKGYFGPTNYRGYCLYRKYGWINRANVVKITTGTLTLFLWEAARRGAHIMMVDRDLAENPLVALTAKQREVLDLLIQHKTSKEISRLLGISPHTVDQRIMLARGKLGVGSRSEVAHAYRTLLETYEQPIYGLSHIGFPPITAESLGQEDEHVDLSGTGVLPPTPQASGIEGSTQVPAVPVQTPDTAGQVVYHPVLPEMFNGPYGTLMRLGYITGITVFLIIIVLGGLSMFAQLSSLLDR